MTSLITTLLRWSTRKGTEGSNPSVSALEIPGQRVSIASVAALEPSGIIGSAFAKCPQRVPKVLHLGRVENFWGNAAVNVVEAPTLR